ncbi:MAG TPA: hypothetical protein VMW67_00145 [Desulfobacteria bacterium]|nr:hypothetical protein [Desulfobacteria bacterium]
MEFKRSPDKKGTTRIPRKLRYLCGYCGGTGTRQGTSVLPCLICSGTGRRPSKLKNECTCCEGSGLKPGSVALPCPTCGGWGYIKR